MKRFSRSHGQRGYASLIGLLMVLAIIMILIQEGYFKKDENGETQAVRDINKAEKVVCISNLRTMNDGIESSRVVKGSVPLNAIRVKYKHYTCPDGGEYFIQVHGKVYCDLHQPPPPGMLVEDFHPE